MSRSIVNAIGHLRTASHGCAPGCGRLLTRLLRVSSELGPRARRGLIATLLLTLALLVAGVASTALGLPTPAGLDSAIDWMAAAACLTYLLECVWVACAAWQPHRESVAVRLRHRKVLLAPTGYTLGSIGLLVFNQFTRLPGAIFGLAILTLVAASSRLALAFRETLTLADARRHALTDDLTGLPNRRRFMSHLREAVTAASASGDSVRVMMFDLDNFKQLDYTLGHSAGDDVLRVIGPRISQALRTTDIVARLGGGEFAILLDSGTDTSGVAHVAETILTALREPFHAHGLALRLSGSLGVAYFPEHAQDPEQLLKCADVALNLARDSRRGWETYTSERDTNSKARLVLASDLATALERGGILAHFQPIVDTASRGIVGAEALVRWRRADGTILSPYEFVYAAEDSGLSRPLTRRMLMLALEQVAGWRATGDDLYVAVNTTVADLMDPHFPEEVASALDIHDVPASALVLEVTESSILSDPERIGAVLAGLRSIGVGVALDDFGTGYSSLTHLRNLAVDQVKIDRSFVASMVDTPDDAAIVYATIELAHKLGKLVVGEGVEDERTWEALRVLQCDRIQGYAIGRPIGPAEFQRLLLRHRGGFGSGWTHEATTA